MGREQARFVPDNPHPMDHTFFSALILLVLVLDPLGCLPIFIPIMRSVEAKRRARVAVREVFIAFSVLVAFMVLGEGFLRVMRLSERSLEVAERLGASLANLHYHHALGVAHLHSTLQGRGREQGLRASERRGEVLSHRALGRALPAFGHHASSRVVLVEPRVRVGAFGAATEWIVAGR